MVVATALLSVAVGAAIVAAGVSAIMFGGWAILGGLVLIGAGIGIAHVGAFTPFTWNGYNVEFNKMMINDTDSNIRDCVLFILDRLVWQLGGGIIGGMLGPVSPIIIGPAIIVGPCILAARAFSEFS